MSNIYNKSISKKETNDINKQLLYAKYLIISSNILIILKHLISNNEGVEFLKSYSILFLLSMIFILRINKIKSNCKQK